MAHRTRIDRMTQHENEANESWDREWTASPTYDRVSSPWKPSLGKSSQVLFLVVSQAQSQMNKHVENMV
jgi:hypothetical protein